MMQQQSPPRVVGNPRLIRDFQVGARTVHALRGIDLRIEPV